MQEKICVNIELLEVAVIPFSLVEGRNLIFCGLKFVNFLYLTSASAHFMKTISLLITGINFLHNIPTFVL